MKKKTKVLWNKKEIDFGRFHYISEYMNWSPSGEKLVYTKYHYGENQSMVYDIKIWDSKTNESNYGSQAQIALRYNLSNPHIDCTVVGLAELDHLKQVIGATKAGPLPEEILEQINMLNNSNR